MIDYLPFAMQLATNLVTVGAFYGAVKVEIEWIKKTLERLEEQSTKRKR